MLSSQTIMILLGCAGGLLPDILRVIKSRYRRNIPSYVRRPNFWLGLFLLLGVGGFSAWLLGAKVPKEAIAYGFGAPELISKLLSKSVEDVDRGEGTFRVREWWAS